MKKILLATDGSKHSFKAVEQAAVLAKALDAEVSIISIAQEIYVYGDFESAFIDNSGLKKGAERVLAKTKEVFDEKGIDAVTIYAEGSPAEAIVEAAEEGKFDLIVLGSRGLGGINRLFMGSVSSRVADISKISVMIVK